VNAEPTAKPFPAVLFWALLVPAVMFVPGCIGVILRPHAPSELVFALFVIPMVMEPVAVLIALVLFGRGGYNTTPNILVTLAGAIPVVAFLGLWVATSHFHI
jgi:NADH:ubiquinone oxidoreductase subunit K